MTQFIHHNCLICGTDSSELDESISLVDLGETHEGIPLYICSECLETLHDCYEMLSTSLTNAESCDEEFFNNESLDFTPKKVKEFLDKYVIVSDGTLWEAQTAHRFRRFCPLRLCGVT